MYRAEFRTSSCLVLIFALLLALQGCGSTIGAKNTTFIEGQAPSDSRKAIVNICRPSAFYKSLETGGVAINGEPVTELGSNEKFKIELPVSNPIRFTFFLPKDNLFIEQKSFGFEMNSPYKESYVIFSVANTDSAVSLGVTAVLGGYMNSNWNAKPVTRDLYEQVCAEARQKFLVHRSLLGVASVK